jgi:hypothetical protein
MAAVCHKENPPEPANIFNRDILHRVPIGTETDKNPPAFEKWRGRLRVAEQDAVRRSIDARGVATTASTTSFLQIPPNNQNFLAWVRMSNPWPVAAIGRASKPALVASWNVWPDDLAARSDVPQQWIGNLRTQTFYYSFPHRHFGHLQRTMLHRVLNHCQGSYLQVKCLYMVTGIIKKDKNIGLGLNNLVLWCCSCKKKRSGVVSERI